MKIWLQALRLAVLIEASSLLVFVVSISRTVLEILWDWFFLLNIPTIFLFPFHIWQSHGREMEFSFAVIPIFVIQAGLWFLVWCGLIWLFRKIKSKLSHKHNT